jgi:hypothetical protein
MSYFKNFQKVDYDANGNGFTQSLTNLTHYSNIGTKYLDDVSFYSYYNINEGERPDMASYNLYGTSDYYWTFFIINKDLSNAFNDWPKPTHALKEFTESKYDNYAAIAAVVGTGFDPIAGKFNLGETVVGQVSGAVGTVMAKYPTLGYITIKTVSGKFRTSGEGIYGSTTQDLLNTSSIVKRAYAPRYHLDDSTGDQTIKRTAGTTPYTNFQYEYDQNLDKSKIRVIKPNHIKEVARVFRREMQAKRS